MDIGLVGLEFDYEIFKMIRFEKINKPLEDQKNPLNEQKLKSLNSLETIFKTHEHKTMESIQITPFELWSLLKEAANDDGEYVFRQLASRGKVDYIKLIINDKQVLEEIFKGYSDDYDEPELSDIKKKYLKQIMKMMFRDGTDEVKNFLLRI